VFACELRMRNKHTSEPRPFVCCSKWCRVRTWQSYSKPKLPPLPVCRQTGSLIPRPSVGTRLPVCRLPPTQMYAHEYFYELIGSIILSVCLVWGCSIGHYPGNT